MALASAIWIWGCVIALQVQHTTCIRWIRHLMLPPWHLWLFRVHLAEISSRSSINTRRTN